MKRAILVGIILLGCSSDAAEPAELTAQTGSSAPLCNPGDFHDCTGLGRCDGTQVCLPDAASYGPCDCGADVIFSVGGSSGSGGSGATGSGSGGSGGTGSGSSGSGGTGSGSSEAPDITLANGGSANASSASGGSGGAGTASGSGSDLVCYPGDFHHCIGVSCDGTQVCQPDAASYGPCDCGPYVVFGVGGSSGSGGSAGTGSGDSGGSAGTGSGSSGVPALSGDVGTPCTSDADCPGAPLVCIQSSSNAEFQTGGPQGGYCSLPCAVDADCAVDDFSFCGFLGYCLEACTAGSSNLKCGADRALLCAPFASDSSAGVCLPRCTSDAACGTGRFCNPGLIGVCMDAAPVGGKVGDPCTVANEDRDCASGVCLEYADPNEPSGSAGSFCSADCTYGLGNGCGFDDRFGGVRQAGCFQPQIAGGQSGDIGYCFPLCDANQDCAQAGAGWVCNPFNDPVAEQQLGRLGECLPSALSTIGSSDRPRLSGRSYP